MKEKRRNFFDHLHSGTVRREALSPKTTLGLGVASLTCLGTLLATGLTLFPYYVPEQEKAYERILHITTTLRFGRMARDLHFVSANVLILLAFLHLIRVFLTAGYKGRRLNWVYGLALLMLVLLGNFTGYLLPWNQISYWAIKVGASLASYLPWVGEGLQRFLLGGEEVGPETLIRSFAIHAGFVPLAFLALTGLHLWRIRRDGGLALPPGSGLSPVPARPWLYRAEGAVALWALAGLILLALVFHAPIFERANPLHPPNPAKGPWYFVGFQEMTGYSAVFGGVVAPAAMGLFLLLVPWLDKSRSPGGKWMAGDRAWLNGAFLLLLLAQIGFIVLGQWFRGRNWALIWPFQ